MITNNIKCAGCGHVGKVDAHNTVSVTNQSDIFQMLGKDSSTGFLYFKCPLCDEDLAVDPLKAIATKQMVGYPSSQVVLGESRHSNRYVPIIVGIFNLSVAILIFVYFSGWWTYLIGGFLIMFGWVSLKTGLFASEKEIIELTEPGPVSEDTQKHFQDRL